MFFCALLSSIPSHSVLMWKHPKAPTGLLEAISSHKYVWKRVQYG